MARLGRAVDVSVVGELARVARDVGFPVVVALWLLLRLDGQVVELVEAGRESVRLLRVLEVEGARCAGSAGALGGAGELEGELVGELGLPGEPAGAAPVRSPWRALSLRQPVTR